MPEEGGGLRGGQKRSAVLCLFFTEGLPFITTVPLQSQVAFFTSTHKIKVGLVLRELQSLDGHSVAATSLIAFLTTALAKMQAMVDIK